MAPLPARASSPLRREHLYPRRRRRRRRPRPHSRGRGSGRNESIGHGSSEVILVARLPLLLEPTGVERGRLQRANRPTDWGALRGKRGSPGWGAGPRQVKRDPAPGGLPGPAGFYLSPRAEWGAERTRPEAQRPVQPVRTGGRTREARGAGHRVGGAPVRWGVGRGGRVLGSGESGARAVMRAQARRSPLRPPRRPWEAQRAAHCPQGNTFWGAE